MAMTREELEKQTQQPSAGVQQGAEQPTDFGVSPLAPVEPTPEEVMVGQPEFTQDDAVAVSYTHLRAHETS